MFIFKFYLVTIHCQLFPQNMYISWKHIFCFFFCVWRNKMIILFNSYNFVFIKFVYEWYIYVITGRYKGYNWQTKIIKKKSSQQVTHNGVSQWESAKGDANRRISLIPAVTVYQFTFSKFWLCFNQWHAMQV